MSDDMSDIFNNIKSMMDSGNIPDNLKEIVNNFKNNENTSSNQNNNSAQENVVNQNNQNSSNNMNFDTSKISPEMINTLSSLLNSSSNENNSNNTDNQSEPSIDINTILKMKTIIESMNQKNDPRANLLYSLKPYLRDNRKSKLDQYVNLLKMTKIADVMKNEKKENNSNA